MGQGGWGSSTANSLHGGVRSRGPSSGNATRDGRRRGEAGERGEAVPQGEGESENRDGWWLMMMFRPLILRPYERESQGIEMAGG